jgi:hypothetical protein
MRLTRRNGFSRSLLFAALAAGGALPWLVLARPLLGGYPALAVYLVGTVAAYLASLAAERSRALAALALATAAGMGAAGLAASLGELALGLGIVLAVGRVTLFRRAASARSVAIEVVLVGGGLVFARFLAGNSPLAIVLAVWGFYLVQSFHPLLASLPARADAGRHPDPFEDACGRALALLDR